MKNKNYMPETSFSLQFNTLSENESFMMQQKLWRLLARKSRRYTMNDSSSLREETAKELYESLCYLLSLYLEEHRLNINDLLQTDLESVLEQALSIAQNKAKRTKRLYEAVCLSLPKIENVYLNETLREIGAFFHRYDVFYFAHQIPCMINYFLCISVSETMRGVSYIEEYLRRLFVENLFIRLFPIDAVDRLLTSVYLNYHESLLNLYSPVLIGAVTLKILGEDPKTLKVTKDRKNKLFKAFEGISPEQREALFLKMAGRLLRECLPPDWNEYDYFEKTAVELYPDIVRMFGRGVIN